MSAPIDRIENVRAQVADVERQIEVCRAAGVQFPPALTWQLLSACRSLLGPTLRAYCDAVTARSAALFEAAWDEGNAMGLDGWTGPKRGTEPDEYATVRRERTVDRLTDELRAIAARIGGDS